MIPTWDRTLPTTLACIDATLRRFGAAPTYLLTDNERVVTVDRVAGLAVRHPVMVAAGPPLRAGRSRPVSLMTPRPRAGRSRR